MCTCGPVYVCVCVYMCMHVLCVFVCVYVCLHVLTKTQVVQSSSIPSGIICADIHEVAPCLIDRFILID